MIITQPGGPFEEPVTLAEVKDWLTIDQDYTGDDELLNELITSNRERMEKYLNISLVDRNGLIYSKDFDVCKSRLELPYGPVDSVTSVNGLALANTNYVYGGGILSGWLSGQITVVYNTRKVTASALKTCLKKLIATDYKYREDLSSEAIYPLQIKALDTVEYYSNNLAL